MIASAIGQFAASLAWSYLSWYLERQTIRDDERRKVALEALEQINKALDWKANNPVVVDSSNPFSDFLQRPKPGTPATKSDDPHSTGVKRPDTDSQR